MKTIRNVRHHRRMRARIALSMMRELRRGWFGRVVLWLYERRVRREIYGELPRLEGNS